ncbi:hypothetical protein MTP99_001428 [Tenebrio molitor]|nr:hypothetical protein MTP99_001428 [Tenebrio molitor]
MLPLTDLNKRFVFVLISVCLVGAFHHGFHIGVFNICHKPIEKWLIQVRETKSEKDAQLTSWIVMTMFPAGCCLGALFSNCRFGHKKIVFYISLLTIGSQVVLNMCREFKSYMMLVMGRFFLGVSAGVCAALAPMYLWDVSPEAWRRVVMVFFQLFISLAMVISQLLGFFMASTNWIIVLVIAVVPVAIGTLALKFCPESPRYVFIMRKNEMKAMMILVWFKNTLDISKHMDEIRNEEDLVKAMPEADLSNIWSKKLLFCFVVVVSEQLCGSSVFIYYSSEILQDVGFDENVSYSVTVGMGWAMLCGTILALVSIETLKPKILLLISLGLMFLITLVLTIAMFFNLNHDNKEWVSCATVASVVLFGLAYGIGVAHVRWLVIAENFNFLVRPFVAALLFPVNFLISAAVVQMFLAMTVSIFSQNFCLITDNTLFLFDTVRI